MKSPISRKTKYTILLCFLIVAFSTRTNQELIGDAAQIQTESRVTGHGPQLSNSAPQRPIVRNTFPQFAADKDENITMEKLNESLSRLEGNLASLIQSFLTLQRSVFNLEQLQELLVLLLEDILKQTGNMGGPNPGTNPTYRGSDSGGTSGMYDGSDDRSDSDRTTSNEFDEDDRGDGQNGGNVNTNTPSGPDNTNNGGRLSGVDGSTDPFQTNPMSLGNAEVANKNGLKGIGEKQSAVPNPNISRSSEENTSRSSEGGRSYSDERMSGPPAPMSQRWTQQRQQPEPSWHQRPSWSEPMTAHNTNNIHSRFQDVVRHIASRMNSFPHRMLPQSQQLGQMQMNHGSHSRHAESTFDHPPLFEPLEIVPVPDNVATGDNKLMPEILPFNVKLNRVSPVISHGGPRSGPERSSSPFLEHLGGLTGSESTGERPTGMINNLVQESSTSKESGKQLHAPDIPTTTLPEAQIVRPDIRRRRQSGTSLDKFKDTTTSNDATRTKPSVRRGAKNHFGSKFASKGNLPPPVMQMEMLENNVEPTEYQVLTSQITMSSSSTNGQDIGHQGTSSNTLADKFGPEYDALIATLLEDLSTKLRQYHVELHNDDATNTNNDVVNRVVSELNKLVWVHSNDTVVVKDTQRVHTESPDINVTSAPVAKFEEKGFGMTEEKDTFNKTPSPASRQTKVHSTSPLTTIVRETNPSNVREDGTTESSTTMSTTAAINTEPKDAVHIQKSENYRTSPHDTVIDAEVVIFSEPMAATVLANHPATPTSEYTTQASSEATQVVTTDTADVDLIQWAWLRSLSDNPEPVDWAWLINALTQLSKVDQLADIMRILSNKGRNLMSQSGYNGEKNEEFATTPPGELETEIEETEGNGTDDNYRANVITRKDGTNEDDTVLVDANQSTADGLHSPTHSNKAISDEDNVENTAPDHVNENDSLNNDVYPNKDVSEQESNDDGYNDQTASLDENADGSTDINKSADSLQGDVDDMPEDNESYGTDISSEEENDTSTSNDMYDSVNNSDDSQGAENDRSDYNTITSLGPQADPTDIRRPEGQKNESLDMASVENTTDRMGEQTEGNQVLSEEEGKENRSDNDNIDVTTDEDTTSQDKTMHDADEKEDGMQGEEGERTGEEEMEKVKEEEEDDNEEMDEEEDDNPSQQEEYNEQSNVANDEGNNELLSYTETPRNSGNLINGASQQLGNPTRGVPVVTLSQRFLNLNQQQRSDISQGHLRTRRHRQYQTFFAPSPRYTRFRRQAQKMTHRNKRQANIFRQPLNTNAQPDLTSIQKGTNAYMQQHQRLLSEQANQRPGISSHTQQGNLNPGNTWGVSQNLPANSRTPGLQNPIGQQNSGSGPATFRQGSQYGRPPARPDWQRSQQHNININRPGRVTGNFPGHQNSQRRNSNPPIAGYPNYWNIFGLNNPSLFAALNPGEFPSMELGSPMDFEEILTNLFQRYWQRVYNLYTRPTPSTTTTIDLDYEAENPTTTTTTTSTTSVTTPQPQQNNSSDTSPPSIDTTTSASVVTPGSLNTVTDGTNNAQISSPSQPQTTDTQGAANSKTEPASRVTQPTTNSFPNRFFSNPFG